MATQPKISAIIINRCNFDLPTFFGSFWSYSEVKLAKRLNLPFVDLEKAKAKKGNWDAALFKYPGAFLCGVGHGNETLFTGQNLEILLNADDPKDLVLIEGYSGSFLSCRFGQSMKKWFDAGMVSMLAYQEDFVFCFANPNNMADPIAQTFWDAHSAYDEWYVSRVLSGMDPGQADIEAYEESQAMFIKKYDEARPGSHKQLLMYDRIIQVHGSSVAVPPPPPPPNPDHTCLSFLKIMVDGQVVYEFTGADTRHVELQTGPAV